MLIQLNIKNFALIEDITVQFNNGFSILSGETGAGKSILIDAIDYVLGGKFSKESIRSGENSTYVEAIFSIDNKNLNDILEDLGIEFEDMLIISRETILSGKSIIKVNGKSLIALSLKKIGEKLLDIHGQHQSQSLLQKSSHITYLDNFIGEDLKEPLNKYLKVKAELSVVREKISEINISEEGNKLIEYTKFQIEDIEKGKLKINEEEELKDEYNILSNAEKINSALNISYGLLSMDEEGNSVIESLNKVINELTTIEKNIDSIREKNEILKGAYYNIEEVTREIRSLAEDIVYDEDRLSKINERLYEINNYKKKYGNTVEEVLKYYDSLKEKYNNLLNSEEILNNLKEEETKILNKMDKESKILHEIRCKYAKPLEINILKELSYVGLEKSRMAIEIEKMEEFNDRGFDSVKIMISTNPGEPLKPLEKVLSGGELSRIMLALKCVFADRDGISSLIFDEIDTGISGAVGQRVGEKMYELSLEHQLLCITHLPQIAVLSDNHYFVSKEVVKNKTFTKIKILSKEEKVMQVASMMGGDKITEATINNVREMISLADIKKEKIKNTDNT